MYKDFKQNYIEQQKQQAAARQARLAKIGMGTAAPATSESEPVRRAPASSAASSTQVRAERPIAAAQRPAAKPAVRYVNEDASLASQPSPQRRQAAPVNGQPQTRRPAQPAQSQAQSEVAKQNTAARAAQSERAQRPATAAAQPQNRRPAAAQTQRPEGAANQRPASVQPAQRPASAQTQRTAAQNPQRSASSQRPVQRSASQPVRPQRRLEETDDDIFKQGVSDSESRAMMFALTGKAEQPDDGGDVDIINMGMIRAPRRKKEEENKKKSNVGLYVGRSFAALGLALLIVILFVFSSVAIIARGPSTTIRDLLVLTAEHSSAAKWVPYLFLDGETVDGIINKSEETVKDVVSVDDYVSDSENEITENEWENAKDGMIFKTVSGPTFKAYVLLVKDPSRIFVGTSQESLGGKPSGDDVFHITKFYNAVAAINGGEFPDNGGGGTGHTPIGLTYSKGKCVYNDGHKDRTFLGITNDNKLVVNEGMTEAKATELGIRDAVSFQKGNTLIQNDGNELIFHYQDGNTGVAQRTGIGQRADGTMILVVTDGRTASSLGATHNDMIDLMVSFGAVTAGLLDGGSSSLMYYKDYYNKYDYDYDKLDEYQKLGLVNNYKAFTEPRKIPTFFIVGEE